MTDALDRAPRLGWVEAPSPIHEIPALGRELGVSWLGIKRDDLLAPLFGGTKVRKLDHLLAVAPYADAPAWAGWGAIGSGQLVALAAAATRMDRRLLACMFWEAPTEDALQNLAYVASGPTEVSFRRSAVLLAAGRPGLLRGTTTAGLVAVPPGATCPAGMLGTVRAGLELAAQVRAGELPSPDRVVVAAGSLGTAAGLAVGLGMAGLRAIVHAVTTVEWPFLTERALRRRVEEARRAAGTDASPAPIRLDRRWIGRAGYGVPTPAARAACARLRAVGPPDLGLEGVYTGKAMAYLLGDPPRGEKVLFWHTARRPGPLPAADGWERRLPWRLRLLLPFPEMVRRRRLIQVGLGAAALSTLVPPAMRTRTQDTLAAAAAALLPAELADGPMAEAAAEAAERYVEASGQAWMCGLALATLEHVAPRMEGRLRRFTDLDRAEAEAVLAALRDRGGPWRRVYRAARDLVMIGAYQQDASWVGTGYPGPWVRASDPPVPDPYAALAQ